MCEPAKTGGAVPTVFIENTRTRVTEWRFPKRGDATDPVNGGDFVESTAEEPLSYPLGIGLGPMAIDVVEWSVPRSALPGCVERALFHASVFTVPENDYTAEFSFGTACGSVLPIPAGEKWHT